MEAGPQETSVLNDPRRPLLGGGGGGRVEGLLGEAVYTLTVIALFGLDLEAHLLDDGTADEPAHAVALPAGRGHEVFQCRPVRLAKQCEDRGLLAALARPLGVPRGFLAPLGLTGCLALGGAPRANVARKGAFSSASGAGCRLWMAFQMRAMAVLRSVNFFTGVAPGKLFQISIKRPPGQPSESLISSS